VIEKTTTLVLVVMRRYSWDGDSFTASTWSLVSKSGTLVLSLPRERTEENIGEITNK
jgi:hypothetical protein